jgi:hypothetical protein
VTAIRLLEGHLGSSVSRIRRLLYVRKGDVNEKAGPLELAFDDASVFLLDGGSDGESLTADQGAWIDPFQDPLSEDNKRFVLESGKWTAFDVSDRPPYSRFIGSELRSVQPITQPSGKVVGARLVFATGTISVRVSADEFLVDVNTG